MIKGGVRIFFEGDKEVIWGIGGSAPKFFFLGSIYTYLIMRYDVKLSLFKNNITFLDNIYTF